jgi:hypothetical protein
MDEIPKIKVIYGKEEFQLTEQELDRIVAIASKKLRNELISTRLGFGMPIKRNELQSENDLRVLKDGYESELYRAMAEPLIYAIENGDLDNYITLVDEQRDFPVSPEVENFPKIDKAAINTLTKIRSESVQDLFARELQKMILMGNKREEIFY